MAISWCQTHRLSWVEQAKQIYSQQIPVNRMRCLLEQPFCRLAVEHEDDSVRSMALVGLFPTDQFIHLDHFDVRPGEDRDRALGRMLAFLSTTDLALDSVNRWDLLTVEVQSNCLGEYLRHGGRRLDGISYLTPGDPKPLAMHLVAFPYRGQQSLSAPRVRELIRVIHDNVHFQAYQSDVDPDLAVCLDHIPPSVPLVAR